jgi:hypothetical protein
MFDHLRIIIRDFVRWIRNRTAHILHPWRKTNVLSCHICLIKTGAKNEQQQHLISFIKRCLNENEQIYLVSVFVYWSCPCLNWAKKIPSSRSRTSDLRISANHPTTVLPSTNWAIEGRWNEYSSISNRSSFRGIEPRPPAWKVGRL